MKSGLKGGRSLAYRVDKEPEIIKGTVERIVFLNEENGFAIAKIRVIQGAIPPDSRDGLATIVGTMPSLKAGESIRAYGIWENDPRYGTQFRVLRYQTLLPASIAGIKRYLASGLIKGIGPITAEKLVRRFGTKTLEIIENEPERLLEVDGIGEWRASLIVKGWKEQKEIRDVMMFLQSHNISPTLAVKIYRHYGNEAIKVVQSNPYRLAEDIFGIGFKTADRIASAMGFDPSSMHRILAGIEYVLRELSEDGHVYVPKEVLVKEASDLLSVDPSLVEPAILQAVSEERVIAEGENIYLPPFYYAEVGIAGKLASIMRSRRYIPERDIEKAIDMVERSKGIRFQEKQREAMRRAAIAGAFVLTGGPGTGKTTTILGMIGLFDRIGMKVLLAAPTGRAAKRLSEATGKEAKTIHRLLEYVPQSGFRKGQGNPLDADVVIVDEMSMVDVILMNNLLKAISPGTSLIMVGDSDQLPSVGPGNVLRDIIASGKVETISLTEIFRQAAESTIVVNAHRVNKGMFPILRGRSDDFFFVEEPDPERAAAKVKELCCNRIPRKFGFDPISDIQVISPMYKGAAGATKLNKMLQDALNPRDDRISYGGSEFGVGDKVMQIRNNYEKDVFNGDIGVISSIDLETQELIVSYPEKDVPYDFSELDEIVPAYAISVHKSQGGEYPAVVMPILTQHYVLLQRNLLYTAITRAKRLVVLIGTKKAIAIAIKNNKPQLRYTSLSERIKSIC